MACEQGEWFSRFNFLEQIVDFLLGGQTIRTKSSKYECKIDWHGPLLVDSSGEQKLSIGVPPPVGPKNSGSSPSGSKSEQIHFSATGDIQHPGGRN